MKRLERESAAQSLLASTSAAEMEEAAAAAAATAESEATVAADQNEEELFELRDVVVSLRSDFDAAVDDAARANREVKRMRALNDVIAHDATAAAAAAAAAAEKQVQRCATEMQAWRQRALTAERRVRESAAAALLASEMRDLDLEKWRSRALTAETKARERTAERLSAAAALESSHVWQRRTMVAERNLRARNGDLDESYRSRFVVDM
jgi:hypothetical protein